MSRFFLHLPGTDGLLDPKGTEQVSIDALKATILAAARDIIASNAKQSVICFTYRVEAENERGEVTYTLSFDQAVRVVAAARTPITDGRRPLNEGLERR